MAYDHFLGVVKLAGDRPKQTQAPPSAPQVTGLTVTDQQDATGLLLEWDAVTQGTVLYYKVKRHTTTGGPYTTIYLPTANMKLDGSGTLDTEYFYVVSVVLDGDAGEGANSAEASGTPTDTTVPTVTLLAPNGGETLTVGVPYNVTWTATDPGGIDYVQIHYRINAGSWTLIDQDETNSGSIPWMPDTAGVNVEVRVTAVDLSANSATDTSAATFTIASGSVSALAPDEVTTATLDAWWPFDAGVLTTGDIAADLFEAAEKMQDQSGNGRTMTFAVADEEPVLVSTGVAFSAQDSDRLRQATWFPAGQSGCIMFSGKISLLEGGDQTLFSASQANEGYDYFAVGVNGTTGQVWKKFRAAGSEVKPYTNFTIEADTQVCILWMSTGSATRIWIDGDEKEITDQDSGEWFGDMLAPDMMSLSERISDGITKEPSSQIQQDVAIFGGVPSDGELAGLSTYGMTVRDPILDTRDPVVAVTQPNGAESWEIGTGHLIQWSASDNAGLPSGSIDIDYSSNSGTDWTPVVADTNNTGSYLWVIPNDASVNCLVRVTATDAAGNSTSDQSDAVFAITTAAGSPTQDSGLVMGL